MMELDSTHATVAALRRLVPEAMIAGGSFAGWLPHPGTLPAVARAAALAAAQDSAVKQCVQRLLLRAGLSEEIEVGTGDGGGRDWPAGFVGSLTHKGTVVLGVIAEGSSVPMVGIDLERIDGSDLGTIEHTIASEGLPRGPDKQIAILLAFSAKEAVFKAQYRRRLDFADVRLEWADGDADCFRADVRGHIPSLVVRSMRLDGWVLSAAIAK